MLDPTLQESCYKYSIRKYFQDNIETGYGKRIYFDVEYTIPKVNGVELTNWYVFHFGKVDLGNLSKAMLEVYLFSRKDPGNVLLTTLRDDLLSVLFDEDATDGLKKIPFLNLSGTKITGIVPIVIDQSEESTGADGTNFKIVTVRMHWGTK